MDGGCCWLVLAFYYKIKRLILEQREGVEIIGIWKAKAFMKKTKLQKFLFCAKAQSPAQTLKIMN